MLLHSYNRILSNLPQLRTFSARATVYSMPSQVFVTNLMRSTIAKVFPGPNSNSEADAAATWWV